MWWVLGVLLVATPVFAQETSEPEKEPAALVAVPSFQGHLPDGTPVIGIIIVPSENVLDQSANWQKFQQTWTTRYRVKQEPIEEPPAMNEELTKAVIVLPLPTDVEMETLEQMDSCQTVASPSGQFMKVCGRSEPTAD